VQAHTGSGGTATEHTAASALVSPSQATSSNTSRSATGSCLSAAATSARRPSLSHARVASGPLDQGAGAPVAATVIGQHAARDAIQPGKRVGRQVGAPAPGDDEHLGREILGHVVVGSAAQIAPDVVAVARVQDTERCDVIDCDWHLLCTCPQS